MQGGFYFALMHSVQGAQHLAQHPELQWSTLVVNVIAMLIFPGSLFIGLPLLAKYTDDAS